MSVVRFRRTQLRAIFVRQVSHGGPWMAVYAGDPWRPSWRTDMGTKDLVLEAVTWPGLRRGLPICVIESVAAQMFLHVGAKNFNADSLEGRR